MSAYIVNQIVDRCHVSRSNRDVIGYMASRIKGGRKAFLRLPRATRRSFMKAAIKRHFDNRVLYARVMRGI